ncbi:site-specific integrase [Asticcacaulis sp. 201]|uniref:tyrosine-type recombinase/integrase n=1 Tax=Asticcacaulis sp. 201 TaxID=3028787 RepID=UPI00291620CB|nr:site-specific integrase [Asticcacaulis sp. 201]MDV6333267.1 site-specific integrase [Asticcacaulis sp. 201]
MASHEILGGKVQLYRRTNKTWHCSASVGGVQHRASTKEEDLELAKVAAEDWYLDLRGKARFGLIKKKEITFDKVADQFELEYETITEGLRSPRWVEGHKHRLRLHLRPFFGAMGISEITAGVVQAYRVHRAGQAGRKPPKPKTDPLNPDEPIVMPKAKPPSRSTIHDEIVTLRQVLKTAQRHGWLTHLPDLSPPYGTRGKISHRPWFSPAEYKQLYTATRDYAKSIHGRHRWNAEQLHDFVLFIGNTGLRPDEAKNLQHRDIAIVKDADTGQRILEIEVRGKIGVGYCKSMPGAVVVYERLLARAKPAPKVKLTARQRRAGGIVIAEPDYPQPKDPVFPGNHIKLFNNLLERQGLKEDRDGQLRTAYSLRHTYICLRLMEGADIYQITKNCRTSVEMIEKYYAAHIKNTLDTSAINRRRPRRKGEVQAPDLHTDE